MDDELGNDEILVALQAIMNECITVLTVLLLYFMRRRRLRSNEYYQGFQRRYSLLHKIPKQIEHLDDVLYPDDGSCFDILRMNRNAFAQFCHLLEYSGGLRSNRNVTVCEQVAMFLSILAHHTKNRIVKHDYKRSGRTVSKHFHGVLNSIIRLHPILLAKPEPVNEDCTNERWKWFKGCLGALDGTYIEVTVPKSDRNRYRSRKGEIAVNVLAVCDREMKFIYVLSGWEGSAADSRVLRGAVTKPNGLRVPRGHMEGESRASSKLQMKADSRRRIWTHREEEVLINALKDIILSGWKCENGFRTGYLLVLEKEMLKVFPNADLRAEPHINSKIHVWKKNYGSVALMRGSSGFGWNDTTKMVDVKSDAVWKEHLKRDSNARTLRYKSFPFYDDWCEIFGKDRATGEHAEDIYDADKNQLETNADKGNMDAESTHNACLDEENDFISVCQPSGNASELKSKSKKRKSVDDVDEKIVGMMGKFCEEANARLGEVAKRIGYEFDMSEKRTAVFEALGKLGTLTMNQQIYVGRLLVNNSKDLEMFFSLPDQARAQMVLMFLSGQIK